MWANHDLCLAKVRLAMGFGSQVEVDKCLARVTDACAGCVQVRDQETAILKRFDEEHRPKPADTPLLVPMNQDEYIEGRSVVDQENKTRRSL
jgi:hypothetical protein